MVYARIGALCYALWGVLHVWVGATVLTKLGSAAPLEAMTFLVDARPESAPPALTPAIEALLGQHGWNLIWIGGLVAASSWLVWRNRPLGAWAAFLLAGLADVGYLAAFVFLGFVKTQTWAGGPTLWLLGALFAWLALRTRPANV